MFAIKKYAKKLYFKEFAVKAKKTAIIFVGAVTILLTAAYHLPANEPNKLEPNDISAYYGFNEMEIVKLDWAVSSLRIVDLNNDSRNDIVIVNNLKSKIELLIQKETVTGPEKINTVDPEDIDINEIFDDIPTRFDRQSIAISQKVYSFVCGDLNSDGMADLAYYGEPKGLYVILQKADDDEKGEIKTLKWRTRKKIKIDDGLPTQGVLACADLNNDDANDLVLASRENIYLIIQKEDGTLAEPVKYPVTSLTRGLIVGDLNGDNINDLIIVTNDPEKPLHVRFGLETGQLGPQLQFFIENPWSLDLHNIDGLTGDEILTVDARSGRLIAYKLALEKQTDNDWPILLYPLEAGEQSSLRDLVVADFDADGLDDVVISDPGAAELIFYRQIESLGLTEPLRFPAFADITNLSTAEIGRNKNKKTILAILSVKEKTIGLSKFEDDRLSFPKPLDVIGEPVAMELGDIDNDNNPDCIYISKDPNEIRSLTVLYSINETDKQKPFLNLMQKKEKTPAVLEIEKLTSNPDGIKIVDVDQDGLKDVLIFVKYELPILVRQTKKRQFELIDPTGTQTSLIKDATLHSITVANVDDTAGEELLVAQKNFARSLVFKDAKQYSVIDQYNAKSTQNNISAVAAFDIYDKDSDSKPQILLLDGQKGRLQILKAGHDKTYRLEKELDVGRWNTAEHLKCIFAPLVGTGAKSILLFDSEKFALITPPAAADIPNHLEQLFSYETKIKNGIYANFITGDINSDGKPDIIMVEHKRNHIEILALDSENKPVSAMRFKIFEQKSYRGEKAGQAGVEPRELHIADVTGDNKNDLIAVIHDRIIIYPQDF